MVLRPTTADVFTVPASLSNGKTFDEDFLLSTLHLVLEVLGFSLRSPFAPSAITRCA